MGVRTLAGGADGNTVTRNTTTPNTTITLVQERLAEAAAVYVVSQDAALEPAQRRLLTVLTELEATPETDRDMVVAQIQALHARLLGSPVAADSEEIEANLALWSELYAISGEQGWAWAGLISALLRDPDFLLY